MSEQYPPRFEEFWSAYPRKVAKLSAAKAWVKKGMEDDLYMAKAAIDDVAKRTRKRWWHKDKSKIPHPATWINAQRWHDEGWEDEIGDDNKPSTPPPTYKPRDPGREVPWEEALLGRLFRGYLMVSGGLPEVSMALAIRDEVLREAVPAYREDVEAEQITRMEVAHELAELFLRRLDISYGLELRERVLAGARRKAA